MSSQDPTPRPTEGQRDALPPAIQTTCDADGYIDGLTEDECEGATLFTSDGLCRVFHLGRWVLLTEREHILHAIDATRATVRDEPSLIGQCGRPLSEARPNSLWLVIYECRHEVVRVSPDGKGFFAPGQEPCWCLENALFIREITHSEPPSLLYRLRMALADCRQGVLSEEEYQAIVREADEARK